MSFLHLVVDLARDGDRVGLGQEGDGDAGRGPAVEIERFAIGLGAELDAPDVADPRDPSARAGLDLDDDVLEIGRVVQAAVEVQRVLEVLPLHRGRRADLAGRDLLALLLDDGDDVLRGEAARLHEVRVQPDPHGVLAGAEHRHVADAVEALEFVLDIDDRVVRQEQAVEAAVRRPQPDEFEDRRRLLLGRDALDLHFRGQGGECGGDPVLHQDLVLVGVRADRESDGEIVGAVAGAGRLHVEHVLDAVDVLLDRQGDGIDERRGARAGIARRDLHGRRHDVRILRGRQVDERDEADDDEEQRQNIGENRPIDEEAGDHQRFSRAVTSPAPLRPASPDRTAPPGRCPDRRRRRSASSAGDRPSRRGLRAGRLRSRPSRPDRSRIR